MNTYIFDFDGTLVDSMPFFVKNMLRILDENNIDYTDDIIKTITPLGYKKTAEYFISMGVPSSTEEIISKLNARAADAYKNRIEAKPNVTEVLKKLKERGDRLNVLTASPHSALDPCLMRLGIFELFDNVWSCDDFATSKSDPQIYISAAEKIGEDIHNIIFLDDNFNADKTAKAAGMKVYGVYDKSSEEFTEEIKSITDKYIRDFKELL